jgi:hypothetical protein
VTFSIVDHSEEVLETAKTNSFYFLPKDTEGFNEDRLAMINEVIAHSTVCDESVSPNIQNNDALNDDASKYSRLLFDVSLPPTHATAWFQSDFTQFAFEADSYHLIIALNCLFYLFNNPKFEEKFHYVFFKRIIQSLKLNGVLFVDKITYNSLKDWSANDIANIEVFNMGGFPNNLFRITRKF